MKKTKTVIGAAILAAVINFGTLNQAYAQPNFSTDGSTTAGWTTDRYPTASFDSTTVSGQSALELTTSSADDLNNRPSPFNSTFYNTQGVTHSANNGGAVPTSWSLSGQLYVTAAMLSGATPMSTSLWGGTGVNDGYYIMDFLSGMSSRTYGAATASGSTVEIWNNLSSTWTSVSSPIALGWNTFDITSDGLNNLNYSVDGVNVFSQTGMGGAGGDPDIGDLSNVYLENDNFFGGGNGAPAEGSFVADWSNISATVGTVPDSASTLGLSAITVGALFIMRRRLTMC